MHQGAPQHDQLTLDLCERIVDIDHVRRRFGYRRIYDLLRSEFPHVNYKRVYRLYRDADNGPEFTSQGFMTTVPTHMIESS